MTLTDSGPLVALLDRSDSYHHQCLKATQTLSTPLLTTVAALTETMHFLGKSLGWRGQYRLWTKIRSGGLQVADISSEMLDRMAELMEEYSESPMDFADASLVAVAEAQDVRRIFTLDSHFQAYRMRGGRKLEVVPKI